MRQHFEISRASEYFDPFELTKRIGRGRDNWTYALFKELIDNALDITDGLQDPEIEIRVDNEQLSVWDNGPGMSADLIESILDFDSRTSDKSAYMGPTRGQQGNAFKTFLGIAYNMRGYVVIESQGLQHNIRCKTNPTGDVDVKHRIEDYSCTGTKVIIYGDMVMNLKSWALNYHLVNPNVKISYFSTYVDGDCTCSLEEAKPVVFYIKGKQKKIKTTDRTSIHWYDRQKFQSLCYLQAKKENIQLRQFVGSFHGLKATAKQKRIAADLPDLLTISESDQLSASLLSRMKDHAKEIKPQALGLIGKATLEEILEPHRSWYKKTCGVHDGKPWAFEVMAAECSLSGVLSAVNHSITFNQFIDGTLSDEWLYTHGGIIGAVREAGAENLLVFVHFIGISPEFASLGKDQIAFPTKIRAEIARQVRLALTTIYKETEKRKRAGKAEERRERERPKKKISLKAAVFQVLPAAVAAATDNGTIPNNKRGVYYKTRDRVQLLTDAELKYPYFGELITEYWQSIGGRDPLIYYDPRGILYEPHSNKEVPLGTKAVLDYDMPEYQYNKILYVEKKGIYPAIKQEKLAQKYDMAVIAAEGFATEAARVLMQKANDQDCIIFVFHDADPAGYEIARTIRDATKTMPNNNISIVDLGLDIETCVDMGLSPETFSRKKALPSGQDFTDIELEYFEGTPHKNYYGKILRWTDCRRVEINAMGSREMVEYLDQKVGEYLDGNNKVIPGDDVQLEEAEKKFADQIEKAVQDAFADQMEEITKRLCKKFTYPEELDLAVEEYLDANIHETWVVAVADSVTDYIEDELADEIEKEIGEI